MNSQERAEGRYQRRKAKRNEIMMQKSLECGSFEDVFSFKNLFNAGIKCMSGVGWKSTTQTFKMNYIKNIYELHQEIINKTYKSDGFNEFMLHDRGKIRNIKSVNIKERIVQKVLCEHVLIPLFSSAFIYDNGASLKNKGMDFTLNRVDTHLQKYYRRHGETGWVLLFDFSNFFASIEHSYVKYELDRRLHDIDLKAYANMFLDNFGEKGYGLGSQISQISALMYATPVDHLIKSHLGMKYYGRYMDDGYIIHNDKNKLIECLKEIEFVCELLGITLNKKKTVIKPLQEGFIFFKNRI